MGNYRGDRSAQAPSGGVAVKYSVVLPFYNEQNVAGKLHRRLDRVMRLVGEPYELIFVNDGSRDNTANVLEQLALSDPHVIFVDLRRNFGQTTALQAGFDQASGEVIIAMDADLQHDPFEIPFFIEKINEGYDVVSGWRIRRADNYFMRRFPSMIANRLLSWVSGVSLHDFGTTFKAYRREVLQEVRLYGDMHRFIPAICSRLGAKICEVPIKNVRRHSGKSNYGIGRTIRVGLDIITVRFISQYMTRPLHFFGGWGIVSSLLGAGILGYLGIRKIIDPDFSLMRMHGPLMMLGFILVVMAMLFLATGLMGEMLMRIYFESSRAKTYAIKRLIRKGL